jgi:di/tricarboxylate transporter
LSDIAFIFIIIAVVVALFAWNRIPVVIVALGTALSLYITCVLDPDQAVAGLGDPAVIFIASLFVVSAGLDVSGVTAWGGQLLIAKAGKSRTLTATLGQLISHTVTALMIIPIGMIAVNGMGISPRPVLMSVAVAAAAAFLTPVATPVNLMVKGPGGYRFGDYAKLGLPLLLWFFVVATLLVPVFWRF